MIFVEVGLEAAILNEWEDSGNSLSGIPDGKFNAAFREDYMNQIEI